MLISLSVGDLNRTIIRGYFAEKADIELEQDYAGFEFNEMGLIFLVMYGFSLNGQQFIRCRKMIMCCIAFILTND